MRYHAQGTAVWNHGERMIYACSIRNFSYSLKKSGLWGKYFPALVASPRCDRCGRAGRTMLAGKGLHYHRKSSIITTQLKKRFTQIPSKTDTRHFKLRWFWNWRKYKKNPRLLETSVEIRMIHKRFICKRKQWVTEFQTLLWSYSTSRQWQTLKNT